MHRRADLGVAHLPSSFATWRHLILNLNREGHLGLVVLLLHARLHLAHRVLLEIRLLVLLRTLLSVLMLILDVLSVLGRLLDHIVELLLRHADHRQFTHLRVTDNSTLLEELLLQP